MPRAAIALLGAWLAACGRPAGEPTGTLVLDVGASDTRDSIDARVANAIEVLQSRTFAQRVTERRKRAGELVVHARRRADSTVIKVSVAAADPMEATELCNAAIMTFLDFEREKQAVEASTRASVIAEQLDKIAADDPRRKQLADEQMRLELDHRALISTVRALDPCALPRR